MEMSTLAPSSKIKGMALEFWNIPQAIQSLLTMPETLKQTRYKALEWRNLEVETLMLVNSRMVHSMAWALTFGKVEALMKDLLKMAFLVDLVLGTTQMEEDMKATGRMTKEMDLD